MSSSVDTLLDDEIARTRETIRRLEDESADDLALGLEQLTAQKQRQETRAHASFARCEQSAALLYAHECAQAEARYAARCEQLQREMGAELHREIQRLKNARDGVSVMDRRRLTRHPKNKRGKGGSAGAASRGGGSGDFSDSGGLDLLHPAEALSPAEETYRQQQEEKKHLEALLSKGPVFTPLTHHVAREEAASDLDAIALVVARRSGASRSRIDNRRCRVAFPRFSSEAPSSDSDDSDDSADSDDGDDSDEDENSDDVDENAGRERPALASRRRLACNPEMLQEGDEVVVQFRRKRGRGDDSDDAAAPGEQRRELSGVITASTASAVFLLCADGTFETLDVGDWKTGRIRVRAAGKRLRRQQ